MKIIRLTLAAFFILAFMSVSFQSFADEKDEVIILFDQSGSFKKPNPRLLSRTWLLTFIQAFNEPCKVVFVGFDENIHEHFRMVVSADNMDVLSQKIGEIDARGRLTDLEMPFKYLLERGRNDAVKLVLIVSDGEPDIWDGKLRRFSKTIKFDNRYEDLNRRYWELKKSNLSPDELFVRLRHLYYRKNLEITEKQASRLKDVLGDRMLIWDLSGESEHLKNWAKKSGARYWPANAKESPVEDIESFVLTVLKKRRAAARESFSKNHERNFNNQLSATLDQKAFTKNRPHPETAETKQEPLPPASVTDKARQFEEIVEDKVKTGEKGKTLSSESITATTFQHPDDSKKALDVEQSKQDQTHLMMIVLVIIVSSAGIAIAIARFRKRPVKDAAGSNKTSVDRQVKDQAANTVSPIIEDLEKTMDGEIRNALKDAEELQAWLLGKAEESFRVDNECSMDVSVPTGAMEVHWIGEDGKKVWGWAVNISEKKVLFEALEFNANSIDHIVFSPDKLSLNVKRSTVSREQKGLAVAVIEEFEDHPDDAMRWIDILGRIDEGKDPAK